MLPRTELAAVAVDSVATCASAKANAASTVHARPRRLGGHGVGGLRITSCCTVWFVVEPCGHTRKEATWLPQCRGDIAAVGALFRLHLCAGRSSCRRYRSGDFTTRCTAEGPSGVVIAREQATFCDACVTVLARNGG